MAGGAQNDGGIICGINVTPLVDITLVLLVVFIVTAKLVVAPARPVELPQASASEETQVIFSVIVPEGGVALVNGEAVADDAAVVRFAREFAARDRDGRAVINADGAVPHRRVVHLLDLLRRGGISRIAFGTQPVEEGVR